ncbi:beta-glucosidase 12 isoform X1 [Cinnamomum micranthum f. kanehirae]|uniref:Beta-glucosidase 12 isoform X1 n=1 Tax=Cinnamomum micranthum f. kanehirae TaxID=337451 RepID=A0A3S3M696_9MAGN|nr:beta-glucosidase 12 isoform X1 [Cinnamomum micranthum f. kanehirae]
MHVWNIGTCFENAIALLVTLLAMRGGFDVGGRSSCGLVGTWKMVLLFSYLISSFLRILSIFEWLGNMGTDHSWTFLYRMKVQQQKVGEAQVSGTPLLTMAQVSVSLCLIYILMSAALHITLFHWDSPQALEDEYGGFLSPNIVDDFHDYANICFKEFGDRVKHWITLNEPLTYSMNGYATGEFAPGRCSTQEDGKCSAGNSATEPYIVSHHLLLAHAAAAFQNGKIGITFGLIWMIPLSSSKSDEDAAHRGLDFALGWYMEPLVRGKYPFSMRSLVGDRLPSFTKEQAHMVKGSFDFIGLNYYSASYATEPPPSNDTRKSYQTDTNVILTALRNGIVIGPKAASPWLYIYPQGIQEFLVYFKEKYKSPIIYLTENGVNEYDNKASTLEEALRDDVRIDFYREHLAWLHKAIREGVDVRGYFAWTLLDNFEWADGYSVRFGMYYVDFENGSKRYPKHSAHWFKKFLKG